MWQTRSDNYVNEKPPIGLKPKHIHDKERALEILSAMQRYTDADLKIPQEWISELSGLVCSQ